MSKKKVLMVHNFYQIGGGEHTVFKNEVEMLRENGHEVIEYTRSNDELKKSKLKLLLLPFTTTWSFKTYHEVKRIIKEQNIDIVHCHNTFPLISPSVYYAARSRNIPVVQTIHNFRFLCPNGIFYRDGKICEECREKQSFRSAIKNKCYRNSKIQTLVVTVMLSIHKKLGTYKKINYIFLTEFNKQKFDHLIDIYGKNVFVKPNFVKAPLTVEQKLCETKTFVFASLLDENKGIKFLLDQWEKMPGDYQLHIYGTGPLENFVKESITNKENIKFYGFQSNDVIFNDLKKAVGMIFPSLWYEGFPMIIVESMAVGCPVVSTNIGNGGNLIKLSNGGAIFSADSEDSFKTAIDKCICNNKELSINAYRFYENVLSKDKNYEFLNKIYDDSEIIRGVTTTSDKIFIYSGRLEENKGILSLLRMWRKLPQDFVLHIYGTGSCRDYVEQVIKESSNIVFYGFQPQQVIFQDVLQSVAVLITSEWYETFGMSIPESFSLATPVVCTDLGNPKLMIEKSNGGVTYKIDDFDSFYASLNKVIDNRAFYSSNALLYFEQELSDQINYKRLSDIYDKARIISKLSI